jgi:putative oxidoreductase
MTTNRNADHAALILRLSLGGMYVAHGMMKVTAFGFAGTAGFFESLGLPGALGYATIFAEVIGGLLLIAGIGSRYVAAALIPVLIGSITFVHGDKGWLFSAEGGGWEYSAFLIAASLVQMLLGDGALALGRRAGGEVEQRLEPVHA